MARRWRAWLLAALTLVAGTVAGSVIAATSGGTPEAGAASPFVSRNGTGLELDGRPLRFTGMNIYNANSIDTCWENLGTGNGLADALSAISSGSGGGMTVIRAWFFQKEATVAGRRDWTALDHTLQVARAHGFLLVPVLGNHWQHCESVEVTKDESWYRGGYRSRSGPDLSSYRDWVAQVVGRYRDDPTIAFWQLMNEAETSTNGSCAATAPESLRSFAADVSALVKSIDARHLVSLGTIGTGQCGASGDQYRQLHALPTIDLCEFHDYGAENSPIPGDRWNGLQVRLDQCRALDKPLIIGEAGLTATGSGGLSGRAARYEAKLSAQFAAGVAGYLAWGWSRTGAGGADAYAIRAGDPALAVLGRFGTPGAVATSTPAPTATSTPPAGGQPGGTATGPPMGFNHYNNFGNAINESTMREIADAMVRNGMRDAGYVYLNIDDSWQGGRDAAGRITANANYPSGIKALADYVHARGLKLGIYTTPAATSCGGKTGSAGHTVEDVQTFAAWGVDFIKLDWCGSDYSGAGAERIAKEWKSAIDASGRSMVLSINAGGDLSVAAWASRTATIWRSGDDICASWYNRTRSPNPAARDCFTRTYHSGIYDYLTSTTADHRPWVGPGHWADPDMLEVGNPGLTTAEAQTHFSLWAMWSAPLIAGNDPRRMIAGDDTSGILLNTEVIAVDQDADSVMAGRVSDSSGIQVWVKPLKGGRQAVLAVNTDDVPRDVVVDLATLGLSGAAARDLWGHRDLGRLTGTYLAPGVPAHGSVMLLLQP